MTSRPARLRALVVAVLTAVALDPIEPVVEAVGFAERAGLQRASAIILVSLIRGSCTQTGGVRQRRKVGM